jgi:adenylate cyclase
MPVDRPPGQERTLTVLFADICDFTRFAEGLPPDRVARFLDAYYAALVPAIEEQGGQITAFMGDSLMALFGTDGRAEHARHAVGAAVALLQRVRAVGPTWAALGYPDIRVGVGVQTGPVYLGPVGGPGRFDQTAVGDTVNAAARTQEATRDLGVSLLIGAETSRQLAAAGIGGARIDPVAREVHVKGRRQPLLLHTVHLDAGCSSG